MKHFKTYYITLLVLITVFSSCKDKNEILHLSLENTEDINRPKTLIKIDVKDYFRGDQLLSDNLVLINNNNHIECQFVDYDFDGQIDEMVFQLDFNKHVSHLVKLNFQEHINLVDPGTKQKTSISLISTTDISKNIKNYEYVTNESERKPLEFLSGGPIWKNSLYTFYNDFYNNKNYLYTESPLEAGSINLMVKDSIHAIHQAAKNNFHVLTDGPVISTFELEYLNWLVSDNNYTIKQKIEIQNDKNYFENTVTINGIQPSDKLILQLAKKPRTTQKIDIYNHTLILNQYMSKDSLVLYLGLLIESDVFYQLMNAENEQEKTSTFDRVALNVAKNTDLKYRLYILKTDNADIKEHIEQVKIDVKNKQRPIKIRLSH